MSHIASDAPERASRRARYLIPRRTPYRTEIVGVTALLLVLAGLSLAPAVLAMAAVLHAAGRLTRWHWLWLALPASAGLVWLLAVGPIPALTAFAATAGTLPAAVAHAAAQAVAGGHRFPGQPGWAAGAVRALPRRLPVALSLATVAAAVARWLDWLHTDGNHLPAPRPGALSLTRRRITAARIAAGEVLTRDGMSLGVDLANGRAAGLRWQDAGKGVLVCAADWQTSLACGFQIMHAAVRRRRMVVAVDLTGNPAIAAALARVCAAAGAPLQVFDQTGAGCYEPMRHANPDRAAELAGALIDWSQAAEAMARTCRGWLADLLALARAAPAHPGAAVLDEVTGLLGPGALAAWQARSPAGHSDLAARCRALAAQLDADRSAAEFLADQLAAVRGSAPGRWLCPDPARGGARITLADAARRRGVVLFSLSRPRDGQAATAVAALVARDLAGYARRCAPGLPPDGLAWFAGCDGRDAGEFATLAADAQRAELAPVFVAAGPGPATLLANTCAVRVLGGPQHRLLAGRVAGDPPEAVTAGSDLYLSVGGTAARRARYVATPAPPLVTGPPLPGAVMAREGPRP